MQAILSNRKVNSMEFLSDFENNNQTYITK